MDQLQQVVLSDVPFIPITEEVGWFQYNTASFTGWPSPSDPYALPAAYAYPDMGQVLLHLAPKVRPEFPLDESTYCAGQGSSCSPSGRRSR